MSRFMTSSSLPGIFRFQTAPDNKPAWAAYLRSLGFGSVALPTDPAMDGYLDWQALGLEPRQADAGDRTFGRLLTHLFCAAENDDTYVEIFQEFTADQSTGQTGLLIDRTLSSPAPVQQFHEAVEGLADTSKVLRPGLAEDSPNVETRARLLAAVSDPAEWRERVLRWKEYTRDVRAVLGTEAAPSLATEYRLYQALLLTWPATASDIMENPESLAALREATLLLAGPLPEAELPKARDFLVGLFTSRAGDLFRKAFIPFAEAVVEQAGTFALAALVLQCTAPGIPEIADGEELGAPAQLDERHRLLGKTGTDIAELTSNWWDGRLRLFILRELLALRTRLPALFGETKYLAQKARGKFADHCIAFTRQSGSQVLLVAVPRRAPVLTHPMLGDAWDMTALEICGITHIHWTNVFTGEESTGPYIALSAAFRHLPVAVFLAGSNDPE
jgi:(1->4)-alpha-D-glucan 1-alpha-D-glucosylmutase